MSKASRRRWPQAVGAAVVAASALWAAPPTQAQEGAMGAMDRAQAVELDAYGHLKRISLDLRGEVPRWEEYQALEGRDAVPDAIIDEYLRSPQFLDVMEDWHRDLLWANVSTFQYIQFPWDLSAATVGPDTDRHTVLHLRRKAVYFRGGPADQENDLIPCGHWPATWDQDGSLELTCDPQTGRCLEGWVWVEPYWAPESPVKVCALDAQSFDASPNAGVSCKTTASRRDTGCGCGPNLAWCDYRAGDLNVERMVGDSLNGQLMQIIRWVIDEDRPYHEILTTRRSYINGPLAHYYKYQMELASTIDLSPAPVEEIFLPDLRWDDPTWVPVLHGPEHSGILTAYGFLLRFQTNRSRVNRFYNAFLDSYFDASKATGAANCVDEGADLTKRCYCQNCHLAVEPWAAHWARWKQQGGGYLSPAQYPVYDQVCEDCARTGIGSCPTRCRNDYVVETVPEDRLPYLGKLRGYEFLREGDEINADAGPRLWVERSLQSGALAQGIVSKLWQRLMQRPFGDNKADLAIRDQLVSEFVTSNYNLRVLVKAIVTQPAYRRIR